MFLQPTRDQICELPGHWQSLFMNRFTAVAIAFIYPAQAVAERTYIVITSKTGCKIYFVYHHYTIPVEEIASCQPHENPSKKPER